MARKKKLTHLEKYIIEKKTKLCGEFGWKVTQENFDRIQLWDSSGRIDNYVQGVKDTWGRWNGVNNYILENAKIDKGGMKASEINRLQREVGM